MGFNGMTSLPVGLQEGGAVEPNLSMVAMPEECWNFFKFFKIVTKAKKQATAAPWTLPAPASPKPPT